MRDSLTTARGVICNKRKQERKTIKNEFQVLRLVHQESQPKQQPLQAYIRKEPTEDHTRLVFS